MADPTNPRIAVSRQKLALMRASLLHRLYPEHLQLADDGAPKSPAHYNRFGPGLEKISDTELVEISLDATLNHLQKYTPDVGKGRTEPTGIKALDVVPLPSKEDHTEFKSILAGVFDRAVIAFETEVADRFENFDLPFKTNADIAECEIGETLELSPLMLLSDVYSVGEIAEWQNEGSLPRMVVLEHHKCFRMSISDNSARDLIESDTLPEELVNGCRSLVNAILTIADGCDTLVSRAPTFAMYDSLGWRKAVCNNKIVLCMDVWREHYQTTFTVSVLFGVKQPSENQTVSDGVRQPLEVIVTKHDDTCVVTASGGTMPYRGTGTFAINQSGPLTFVVTDATGLMASKTITR